MWAEQMKKQIYPLTEQTYGLILEVIQHAAKDGSLQITIHDAKEKRSVAQNALYWAWLASLSEDTGNTVDFLHKRFAQTYMLRIYLVDPVTQNQEEWVGLYDVIKEDGTPLMIKRALQTISTTWATVEQFKEYLNQIERFCHEKELHLPANPNYTEAMQ